MADCKELKRLLMATSFPFVPATPAPGTQIIASIDSSGLRQSLQKRKKERIFRCEKEKE
jgi:hypothetical protein